MTKSEALYKFFNGFGMKAYPTYAVPMDTTYPWMTYDSNIGNAGDEVSCSVKLWFYTLSEAVPNAKVDEIARAIGLGGKVLSCEDGAIWIKRDTPWSQAINDENDTAIKGRMLSLKLEFL